MTTTRYAIYPSPVGFIRIEHRAQKLLSLQILCGEPLDRGEPDGYSDGLYSQLLEYFRGERFHFDVEIDITSSTAFQRSVLCELRHIPYGETRSYKDIAVAIGSPKAARAVGAANNRNPIHIIIPCHRVVGVRGALTGYAAGLDVKEFLLGLEQSCLSASATVPSQSVDSL